MSSKTDTPTIVPDLEQDKTHEPSGPVSAALIAAGHSGKRTSSSALAGTHGTRPILRVFVQGVFTSGLRPSASRAVDGRRIRTGMRVREK